MGLKTYKDELTVEENQKGVLDLDTVKGCTFGCQNCKKGCWGLCYAYKIATFRGIDFTKSVTRWLKTKRQIKEIGKKIFRSNKEFIRFYSIALKSANETKFWLCLIRDSQKGNIKMASKLLQEANELSKMIGASILTMKGKITKD